MVVVMNRGGGMSKTRIIVVTAVAFLLVGGLIILWSVYQQTGTVQPQMVSNIQSFTDENFEKDVVEASKKRAILVDFYAEWCFPCRMLDPILQEVAKDLNGCATIGKINTDKNLIPRRFGINKIPAIFIIRDGEIKNAFYGVVPKETILKALEEFCS
jgi:thioredoxin 1